MEKDIEELKEKSTKYLKISFVLAGLFVVALIATIAAKRGFTSSQIHNQSYDTVEAYVKGVENLGKTFGAKTPSYRYKIELLYNNERFEIVTTNVSFANDCENKAIMNQPVTVYYYNGKLYDSANSNTNADNFHLYLFCMGITFALFMASAMCFGAVYDYKKKIKQLESIER